MRLKYSQENKTKRKTPSNHDACTERTGTLIEPHVEFQSLGTRDLGFSISSFVCLPWAGYFVSVHP